MGGRLLTLACLLVTGGLLALSTILAKLAPPSGLSPIALLAWSVLGAALILLAVAALRGHLPTVSARTVEYSLISALVSFAAPNLIFYSAIPHVGVGFVALAIAFPPLFTYAGALALGMERFAILRATGVALALGGAAYIAYFKLNGPAEAMGWILAVMVGPLLLAIGNLYRTSRWPPGARPDSLAGSMLIAAAALLLIVGLLPQFSLSVPPTRDAGLLIGAQIVTFAAQFSIFFILQKRGGPVYISLLGAVAATVGVPVAIALLGEAAPQGLAIGGILIAAGLALVTMGDRSPAAANDARSAGHRS